MSMRGMQVAVERTDDTLVRGTLDFVDEGVKCVVQPASAMRRTSMGTKITEADDGNECERRNCSQRRTRRDERSRNSVVIRDAEVRPLEGDVLQHVSEVWIKAKHVRYLHYPRWVQPSKIMEDMRTRWDAAGIKYTQPQHPPSVSKTPP